MKVFANKLIRPEQINVFSLRRAFKSGDNLPPKTDFQTVVRYWTDVLGPQRFTEPLDVVDRAGAVVAAAPRWFVHLMGLRHLIARVLLVTESGNLVYSVRSGLKPAAAGSLDFSAGGHVLSGQSIIEAAFAEMKDELGLEGTALVDGELVRLGRPQEIIVEKQDNWTLNHELTSVFLGRLNCGVDNICFPDGETTTVFEGPAREIRQILNSPRVTLSFKLAMQNLVSDLAENLEFDRIF